MKTRKVKYRGHSRYSFQGETLAEVLRIVWVKVESEKNNGGWRLALHLRYPDGRKDFASLLEAVEQGYLVMATRGQDD